MLRYLRFPAAEARFDTTLPRLLRIRASCRRPPTVFSLLPRSTSALAKRPRATLETRLPFITLFVLRAVDRFAWVAIPVGRAWGRAMASRQCCNPGVRRSREEA